ncbi:MAG: hypothetical protein K2X03_05725 [Bryobacteraceae bacterium]|nr:hypothetical protein [Bryobacteraceae bacterium]
MTEWKFAHAEKAERFAQIHYFSMVQNIPGTDRQVEFIISVKEYVNPEDPAMVFFASADKKTNQGTLPFTPCGWGNSLLKALSECMRAIRRFPYEGE